MLSRTLFDMVLLKKCLRQTAIIILFALILALLPLLLVTALALVTTRTVLGTYKWLFKKEYGNFLTGMSNAFSSDSPYDSPVITVGGYVFFDGHLELRDFRAEFSKRLRASPLFPQLKQYLTTWMGFSVWKQDPHFNLDNHVKELDDSETLHRILGDDRFITEENVLDVLHKFTKIPFAPKMCPWDFHLCHQVKLKDTTGPVTAMFVRVHHTMGDATAITRMFALIFDSQIDPIEQILKKLKKGMPKVERTTRQQLLYLVTYPVLSIYEAVKHLIDSWDRNTWNNFRSPMRTEFNYFNFRLQMAEIQQIRKVQGDVSFFSVVLAAHTAALRRHMIKYNVPVPKNIHANVTIPIPTKGTTLTNNMTFVCVTLPVGLNNRNQMVQKIHQEQMRLKTSRVPLAFLALSLFNGLLPKKLLYTTWRLTTCAATNFPGFEDRPSVLNRVAVHAGSVAATPSTIGIYMWCFGFADITSISLGASKDIMDSRSKVEECARFMHEELNALKQTDDPFVIPERPCSSKSISVKKRS